LEKVKTHRNCPVWLGGLDIYHRISYTADPVTTGMDSGQVNLRDKETEITAVLYRSSYLKKDFTFFSLYLHFSLV